MPLGCDCNSGRQSSNQSLREQISPALYLDFDTYFDILKILDYFSLEDQQSHLDT
jgi:hypothetical protein